MKFNFCCRKWSCPECHIVIESWTTDTLAKSKLTASFLEEQLGQTKTVPSTGLDTSIMMCTLLIVFALSLNARF